VVLLATLSPESVWKFFSMNALPLGHGIELLTLVVALLEPEHSECAKVVQEKLTEVCEEDHRSAYMWLLSAKR